MDFCPLLRTFFVNLESFFHQCPLAPLLRIPLCLPGFWCCVFLSSEAVFPFFFKLGGLFPMQWAPSISLLAQGLFCPILFRACLTFTPLLVGAQGFLRQCGSPPIHPPVNFFLVIFFPPGLHWQQSEPPCIYFPSHSPLSQVKPPDTDAWQSPSLPSLSSGAFSLSAAVCPIAGVPFPHGCRPMDPCLSLQHPFPFSQPPVFLPGPGLTSQNRTFAGQSIPFSLVR